MPFDLGATRVSGINLRMSRLRRAIAALAQLFAGTDEMRDRIHEFQEAKHENLVTACRSFDHEVAVCILDLQARARYWISSLERQKYRSHIWLLTILAADDPSGDNFSEESIHKAQCHMVETEALDEVSAVFVDFIDSLDGHLGIYSWQEWFKSQMAPLLAVEDES